MFLPNPDPVLGAPLQLPSPEMGQRPLTLSAKRGPKQELTRDQELPGLEEGLPERRSFRDLANPPSSLRAEDRPRPLSVGAA